MEGLIFVWVIMYIVGCLFSIIEYEYEPYEVLLWPLLFIKYMLKGLFKVVFTGWRD